MKNLSREFYLNGSVTVVARRLLGKKICTLIDGKLTSGIIVETEAYAGRNDKACHANNGRRTNRNDVMYGDGGAAYVYFCYGIHYMFNVVTNVEGLADAVLIRAFEPMKGLDFMLERRGSVKHEKLGAGPGNVCKALGINLLHNRADLLGDVIWIEDATEVPEESVITTTRVGVDYAGEDALFPWRYYVKGNRSVSKK